MANKYLKELDELEGMVDFSIDPYATGIISPSPSVNFIFANTHLIPFGASVIFWGPPKGGKSLLCNMIAGELHRQDPDAVVIKLNTEIREHFQMTPRSMKMFGIDPTRYKARNTNRPEEIFDFIEKDVVRLCQKGVPIKLIIIDSVTDILGRRAQDDDTVMTQQRGDEAQTLQVGLKRIKSLLRTYGITLLMVSQERAVQDPVEIMRGKKTQMAGAYYLKHFAEYFVYVAPNEAKEGKSDELGNLFTDDSLKDIMGNSESTAMKIKVLMQASSVGLAKRAGEFTFHKFKGLINTHEEAFRLGCARGIIERPNNRTYIVPNFPEQGKESKWTSFESMLQAVQQNNDLEKEIVRRVKQKDIELFKNGITDDEDVDASVIPQETVSE